MGSFSQGKFHSTQAIDEWNMYAHFEEHLSRIVTKRASIHDTTLEVCT